LERGATVVVNVLGETVEEYAALASALSASAGVGMLEVNVSCPNVREGGLAFGQNPRSAADVVAAVAAEAGGLPVMVKLTPMAADISEIAFAVVEAGAQALSLINTVPAMAVDLASRRPVLANIIGGLSGPAVKPLALRLVWEVSRAVSVPVVGIGGIMNSEDALEFMLAGASAVQVGTANFVRPRAALDVLEGIRAYMIANDLADLSQIIGRLETG
jgi:dihydroorotate dehydrogenase (NAD+) catalytic subunit